MAARTIEQLSETIARTSAQLSLGLQSQGLASPTLNDTIKGPDFEAIDAKASSELADAAYELERLVIGPSRVLYNLGFLYHDVGTTATILDFNIPWLIPLDGTATIADLASQTGLSEDKVTRVIRYATTNFIFREPSPGIIAHTAISAAMVRDPKFSAFIQHLSVHCSSAGVSLPATFKKWPRSEKVTETTVNLAHATNDTFYTWLGKDPVRQNVFDRGMDGLSGAGLFGDRQYDAIGIYPWAEKLGEKASVVDVGGGSGHISRALALAHPGFTVTVQDHVETFSAVKDQADLPPNLSFQERDFWDPQPIRADAYLFRRVFHNWPREESIDILKQLIPALKPGARILISEFLMPGAERGESLIEDKMVRQMDMQMMIAFNAKERTVEDYIDLFQGVDERLKFQAKYQLPGDHKSVMVEAVWEGDS